MTVSHQVTDADPRWVDIRNISGFIGQEFTAGHTGNKDLTDVKITGRVFGSHQDDASLSSTVYIPVPLPSVLTYYGTNNFGGGNANFLSGNVGVYADYQVACAIKSGQILILGTLFSSAGISGGGDVQFDVTITNVGGSQIIVFPVHLYNGSTPDVSLFRVETTEDWVAYKIEFDNFTWNGTGTVTMAEVETFVNTPISTWTIDNETKLTVRLYDDTNLSVAAVCQEIDLRSFLKDVDTEFPAIKASQDYALVGTRDYKLSLSVKDIALLSQQLENLDALTEVNGGEPILLDTATPQVQIEGTEPENLFQGYPEYNSVTTVSLGEPAPEINPDAPGYVFSGEVRQVYENMGTANNYNHIRSAGVIAGETYTFKLNVRVPQTGVASTYTVKVVNSDDGSILASRSQALVDQVPDYYFNESLSVVVPADCSTIVWSISFSSSVPLVYYDGLMLTKDTDGTPARYYYSPHVGAPACVALQTASTEPDTMYSWASSAWALAPQNSFITTIDVGTAESELPTAPESIINDMMASVFWPGAPCDQPPVMEELLSYIQQLSDLWFSQLRPIIQVNKPVTPTLADWLAAYRKSGGAGDLPANGSFRWSDSSQSEKEWTAEYVILPFEQAPLQPIPTQENGTSLLGSTTRLPFSFTFEDSDFTPPPNFNEDFTGARVIIDLLREGSSEIKFMASVGRRGLVPVMTEADLAQLNLVVDGVPISVYDDPTPKEGQVMSMHTAPDEMLANMLAVNRSASLFPGVLAAGERDLYIRFYLEDTGLPIGTDDSDGKVYEYSVVGASYDPEDVVLPLSQLEVYYV